ncbi:NAD(P)-dependent oxidoreductase [Novispirillum itersonii]|uniref:Lactate dehydrogenase-like 2-hydroxyacid dehydrogenase n=1 Tax=Novispirillum itersonii TaxID=189 RepID=A0A7X0DPC3_NOVIT|nr:NAD(P)-dependent oxidoreductase [Novispirillum itersonii]MBB6211112.1 lactate dehydrogenase-like 2-hydroxyacid dehydrogenase [Novispirillum itersonii]
MSKPVVLLACDFSARFKALLAERYTLIGPLARSAADALPPGAEQAAALITKGGLPTDAALLAALPGLGIISFFGTGYEGVDLTAAAAQGVTVTHSPGANAASVADFAMGLVLASARQIVAADRFVREGRWGGNSLVSMPAVPGLTGTRLGLYGYGAIGEKVAARAAAFDMEIAYHSRSPKAGVPYLYKDSPLALADWADIFVVAVRADASNRHTVNRALLAALGPQGHVINVARGSMVDSEALAEALEQGTIAGAALDVVDGEPQVPDCLLKAPNLILTPHIAYASTSARDAQEDRVLANLVAFFAGQPVPNPVPV